MTHGRSLHRLLRTTLTLAAAALLVGLGFWLLGTQRHARDGRRELAAAAAEADRLGERLRMAPAESVRAADAITSLYLERLRLGLGSPFRLMEQAGRDPMLVATERERTARALLARTISGAAFRVEGRALELIAADGNRVWGSGAAHLRLIDSVVAATADPRVGELAVRLAYRLAAAAGTVAHRAPDLTTQAAALARDRVLAVRDGQRLLAWAARRNADPLGSIPDWRARGQFAVERPVMTPLSGRMEREAVEALPALLARIEEAVAVPAPPSRGDDEFASDGLARRMAGLAETRHAPVETPVSIAVGGFGPFLLRGAAPGFERDVRRRFLERSLNEESLAAEYALLRARTRRVPAAAAAATMTAAVALRPFAQEDVWFSGDAAPTSADVVRRFGLSSIAFDRAVPMDWQPYFRRQLSQALDDLKRVFPLLDFRGLAIRFGDSPLGQRALAMHDPSTRTMYLPVGSAAGAVAHEFAHDLDWQAARDRYGSTSSYRTDRAMRLPADRLAGVLRRMAAAPPPGADPSRVAASARPTEVFARHIDWFVGAILARDGRMNGFLSAVQDPVLTGYASATSPEIAPDGADATLSALEGMSAVAEADRAWFYGLYGAGRDITVHEAVRRVLEAEVLPAAVGRVESAGGLFAAVEGATALLRASPAASSAWRCVLDAYAARSTDAAAVRAVVQFAAEARARGIIRRWSGIAARIGPDGPWRLRALTGAPWAPAHADSVGRELRDAILWRAMRVDDPQHPADVWERRAADCRR